MSEGVDAALFYLSVASLVAGGIRAARAAIERRSRDGIGIALAAAGLLGLAIAVMLFETGPRSVLPF
jgi:uncharacterized membrane protein YoaK (UPF0700 family)